MSPISVANIAKADFMNELKILNDKLRVMLRAASWRFARDVMVVHSNRFTWDVSKLKLVRTCKAKTFKIEIPIILNVDQKPPIQIRSVANVVLPTTAPKSQPGKFKNSRTTLARVQ